MWTFDQLKPFLSVFGSGILAILVRGTLDTFWSPSGWERVAYYAIHGSALALPWLAWLYVDRYGKSSSIENPQSEIQN